MRGRVVRHTTNGIARPRIVGEALVVRRGRSRRRARFTCARITRGRLEPPLKIVLRDRRQLLLLGGLFARKAEFAQRELLMSFGHDTRLPLGSALPRDR
jgi:hypothetical protein